MEKITNKRNKDALLSYQRMSKGWKKNYYILLVIVEGAIFLFDKN
jgi:hypothetical protein